MLDRFEFEIRLALLMLIVLVWQNAPPVIAILAYRLQVLPGAI